MSLNCINIGRYDSSILFWAHRLEFLHPLNFFEVRRCFDFCVVVVSFYVHVLKTVFCFNAVCNLFDNSEEGINFLFIFLISKLAFESWS